MKVPGWLGHLRTDPRGRPVPYVNRWGPERTETLALRWDPALSATAVFQDDQRETEPDFFAQNMQRQRACMMDGLCQVCGRPVPWRRRLLVMSTISTKLVDVDGLGPSVVMSEPWIDARCADFALTVCPGLIRRRNAEDLTLISMDGTSPQWVRVTGSRGWIDGPLEAESRRVMPVLWVKVIVATVEADRPPS